MLALKALTAQCLAPVQSLWWVFHTTPNTWGSTQKPPRESSLLPSVSLGKGSTWDSQGQTQLWSGRRLHIISLSHHLGHQLHPAIRNRWGDWVPVLSAYQGPLQILHISIQFKMPIFITLCYMGESKETWISHSSHLHQETLPNTCTQHPWENEALLSKGLRKVGQPLFSCYSSCWFLCFCSFFFVCLF